MEMRGGEAGNLEKRAWKKKMETKSKAPHVKPTCWAPQFRIRIYRPGHPPTGYGYAYLQVRDSEL